MHILRGELHTITAINGELLHLPSCSKPNTPLADANIVDYCDECDCLTPSRGPIPASIGRRRIDARKR